jgi:hypothetical protein
MQPGQSEQLIAGFLRSLVVVHGLHRAAVTQKWPEGDGGNMSIRYAFEQWTGRRARLMTYNYPPMTLTPRRIHLEASSLLGALRGLRTGKEAPRPIIFMSQDVGGLIVKAVGGCRTARLPRLRVKSDIGEDRP